jgi:hypothetical protein
VAYVASGRTYPLYREMLFECRWSSSIFAYASLAVAFLEGNLISLMSLLVISLAEYCTELDWLSEFYAQLVVVISS